jgi:hypothetical protein
LNAKCAVAHAPCSSSSGSSGSGSSATCTQIRLSDCSRSSSIAIDAIVTSNTIIIMQSNLHHAEHLATRPTGTTGTLLPCSHDVWQRAARHNSSLVALLQKNIAIEVSRIFVAHERALCLAD